MRLFERHPGGYAPTAQGEEMLAAAERVEGEVLGLERRLLGRDVELVGSLRVTTTDTLAHGLLMPHLKSFRAVCPGVEVELIVSNTFFNLTKREADVALRPTRQPEGTMVGRRLAEIAVAVYGSRAPTCKSARYRTAPIWAAMRSSPAMTASPIYRPCAGSQQGCRSAPWRFAAAAGSGSWQRYGRASGSVRCRAFLPRPSRSSSASCHRRRR